MNIPELKQVEAGSNLILTISGEEHGITVVCNGPDFIRLAVTASTSGNNGLGFPYAEQYSRNIFDALTIPHSPARVPTVQPVLCQNAF